MLLAVCSNTCIGNKQVCESVEKLQNALRKRCNLEGLVFSIDSVTSYLTFPEENHRLREQISSMKEVSVKLENVAISCK